jgi:hypothetical protein
LAKVFKKNKNQLNLHYKFLFPTFAYFWGKEKEIFLEEKKTSVTNRIF